MNPPLASSKISWNIWSSKTPAGIKHFGRDRSPRRLHHSIKASSFSMTHKSGLQLAKLQFLGVVFEENLCVFIVNEVLKVKTVKDFPIIISFWANLLKKKTHDNKPWIFFSQNGNWLVVSNLFYFHPYLEKWLNLTNIFQMGCNHHLGKHWDLSSPLVSFPISVQTLGVIFFGTLKLTWPGQMDGWKTIPFLLGTTPIFRG